MTQWQDLPETFTRLGHQVRTISPEPGLPDMVAGLFGLPVGSVRLVDPRFYHLDTALCVLDADTAAYYPAAFDDAARAALASQVAAAGFEPVPVDVSEFLKAGGGPKCCTPELRS